MEGRGSSSAAAAAAPDGTDPTADYVHSPVQEPTEDEAGALVQGHLSQLWAGPSWAGPLWAPLGPYGPGPYGPALIGPPGLYGPGPSGPPWALMGRAFIKVQHCCVKIVEL